MNRELQMYKRKRVRLAAQIAILGLPVWLYARTSDTATFLIAYAMRAFKSGLQAFNPTTPEFTVPMPRPAHTPLTRMINGMAKANNVSVEYISAMNQTSPFAAAAVYYNTRLFGPPRIHAMIFDGNPFLEENGERIARGIIAHEISHALSRGSDRFNSLARDCVSYYALLAGAFGALAGWTTAAGINPDIIPALTITSYTLAGVSATLTAAAIGARHLVSKASQNEEFLSDLNAAKLSSPDDVRLALELLDAKSKQSAFMTQRGELSHIWRKIDHKISFMTNFETHPPLPERLAALNRAYPPAQPHKLRPPKPQAM